MGGGGLQRLVKAVHELAEGVQGGQKKNTLHHWASWHSMALGLQKAPELQHEVQLQPGPAVHHKETSTKLLQPTKPQSILMTLADLRPATPAVLYHLFPLAGD